MQQKLRIAMIITNYGFGGAQKAFADHSRILKEYAEVREYVFNDFEEQRLYDTGNPYYSLNVPGGGGVVGNFRNLVARVHAFRQFKKEFQPHITISFMEGADYVSMLSGGEDRKIIVIQGSKVGDKNISGIKGLVRHRLLMPWLYRKADRLIGVSADIKKELTGFYGLSESKVAIVHNFYDEENLERRLATPVHESLQALFQRPGFKLITFARLAAQKNLAALFPVFEELKKAGEAVSLFIIGDGDLRTELLEQASGVGRVWSTWKEEAEDPDIFFLGFQDSPMAFLKYADLFLMPSLWEGSPLALCEAMASGIAVCSTDCPTGPREIIDETNGNTFGILKNGGLLPMIRGKEDTVEIKAWVESIQDLIHDRSLLESIKDAGGQRVKQFSKTILGPLWAGEYLNK